MSYEVSSSATTSSSFLEPSMYTSEAQIDQIEQTLQYTFYNKSFLKAAIWNRETTPDETQELATHGRESLAAIGESTIRTAFLLEGFPSASSPEKLAQQLQNPELAAIGFLHGLDRLVDISRNSDRADLLVATMVKAILGAVFLDSSHSMLAVKTVMEALGFCFNQVRETISHQQRLMLRLQQLEGSSITSRTASPDCFNGPDCGCGCLWLDQYSSAGWYTPPLKDPISRSSAHMSPFARSHSFKRKRYQPTTSRSSMERLKDWIVHVEPGEGCDVKSEPWIKDESQSSSSSSKEQLATSLNESLALSKHRSPLRAESK